MPHFFKNFPITGYQFKDNNTNQIVVDIFRHVKAGVTVDDAAAYAYLIFKMEKDQIMFHIIFMKQLNITGHSFF